MPVQQPHCPTCKRKMTLVAVEPFGGPRPHYERRRYECSACDLRESHIGEHGTMIPAVSMNCLSATLAADTLMALENPVE
jgi:hypothetical protein